MTRYMHFFFDPARQHTRHNTHSYPCSCCGSFCFCRFHTHSDKFLGPSVLPMHQQLPMHLLLLGSIFLHLGLRGVHCRNVLNTDSKQQLPVPDRGRIGEHRFLESPCIDARAGGAPKSERFFFASVCLQGSHFMGVEGTLVCWLISGFRPQAFS